MAGGTDVMGEASDISVVVVVPIESGIVWHLESACPERRHDRRDDFAR